jgi:streptogramin lyase
VGIACILPNGTLKEYGYSEGLESRLLCLRETTQGRIYASGIGEGTYLYRYLPEEDAFVNLSLPFDFSVSPNFEVHDLTLDKEGVIWMASTNGLLRYDMDRVRRVDLGPEYTDIEVRAVMDMPDGSIWVSTDTEGMIRYEDGETVVVKEESGLPSKVMTYRCLAKDQKNRLWVGTAEGLVYSLDPNPAPVRTGKPLLISAWWMGHGFHARNRVCSAVRI